MEPINFYFLSTGFCGTRFYHHALKQAGNAEVWHQPGHEDIAEIVNLMEDRFDGDPKRFMGTSITEFPRLKRRIDKRLSLPWIYGDTLNWMRGLGAMLYEYIGPDRLRLVQLVRHPVATCRSMLADARQSSQVEYSDIGFAREVARRWVHQYSYIRHQFQQIDNERVCRTVRLEDIGLQQLSELYGFLSLEGFDESVILALLSNTTKDVRHYHRKNAAVPASREELRAIWEVCRPLATEYGYQEEEEFYSTAPSRSTLRTTPPPPQDEIDRRPAWVKLHDYRGLGLILRCPSGIRYVNTGAGPLALWLRGEEGAFVPLAEGGEGTPADRLLRRFLFRRDKEMMSSINEGDADFIDSLLAETGMDFIKVNRSRLGEQWDLAAWETWDESIRGVPWEAWVPVHIRAAPYTRLWGVLTGCDGEGILVWENSN